MKFIIDVRVETPELNQIAVALNCARCGAAKTFIVDVFNNRSIFLASCLGYLYSISHDFSCFVVSNLL